MKFSKKDIDQLVATGKIRGYVDKGSVKSPVKKKRARPVAYDWLDMNLRVWCMERGLTMEKEHRFHPERKWRFDYAIIEKKIAVEYEGIFGGGKSRHTTVTGYTEDTEKYSQAAVMDWKLIRVTAKNYKSTLNFLNDIK